MRSAGIAQRKPRLHLLVVPIGDVADGASNVFSLAALSAKRECRLIRVTNLTV